MVVVVVASAVPVLVVCPGFPLPLVQRPFSHDVPAGHGSSGPQTAFPSEPMRHTRLEPSVTHSWVPRVHSSGGRVGVGDEVAVVVVVVVSMIDVPGTIVVVVSMIDVPAVSVGIEVEMVTVCVSVSVGIPVPVTVSVGVLRVVVTSPMGSQRPVPSLHSLLTPQVTGSPQMGVPAGPSMHVRLAVPFTQSLLPRTHSPGFTPPGLHPMVKLVI